MSGRHSYTLFATPLGTCGMAWGESGVVSVSLPASSEGATAERLERSFAAVREHSLPDTVLNAIDAILSLMAGRPDRTREIPLDMTGVPAFNRRVYAVAREIEPGRTLTYGDVAKRLDEPGAARAVGRALGQNPFPIVVPCHRVLGAGAWLGGFSAPGGQDTKLRLLALEGLDLSAGPSLFDHAGVMI